MIKNNKKAIGAFLGTIVEYYDYSLYGFSAAILADKFFPEIDKTSSLMYIFGIYALSYLAKPLGSIFFSRIGDKYGRRITLKITMIGIALPTVIIGLLPEYNTIGVIATAILILCKFFQGFFVGAEYDGAAIYTIEHLDKKYHYTASAVTRFTGVVGLLLSIASTNFFNSSIFPEWGWRIPFLLSLPLAGITIYYRQFLEETPAFIKAKKEEIKFINIIGFIKKQYSTLFLVILFSGGFGVTYQISVIFMKEYLKIMIPSSISIMSTFSIIIVFCFGITMPISGLLADRFGKNIVFKISLLMTLISCSMLIIAIEYQLLNLALISAILIASSVAPFNALAHGVIIKAFNPSERYRGVSLGHATGSLLMSGTANYICLLFMKKYHLSLFPIFYTISFAIVAFFMIKLISKREIKK
ncbi:MAG: MFS transporter [Acinetobacter sp.]|uniref:MFS transporter n=1 Tax=Acinetobacter sp. TaxID=472 RepID=UPI000FB78C09|nr:MFS transporter [Acinetobacter sp.]RUP42020.1 MAG: MFS transporter [Acinetobacter sp.]